jgi:hypothetical protein
MADTGDNNKIFIEDIDPSSILIKDYLMKFIYSSNRFNYFTTKLSTLLERIENTTIRFLVENMYEKMEFLIKELKEIEKNETLLIKYINKINELYKYSQEFDNILLFYSYQPKK